VGIKWMYIVDGSLKNKGRGALVKKLSGEEKIMKR
jgi:hypothetical protein